MLLGGSKMLHSMKSNTYPGANLLKVFLIETGFFCIKRYADIFECPQVFSENLKMKWPIYSKYYDYKNAWLSFFISSVTSQIQNSSGFKYFQSFLSHERFLWFLYPKEEKISRVCSFGLDYIHFPRVCVDTTGEADPALMQLLHVRSSELELFN